LYFPKLILAPFAGLELRVAQLFLLLLRNFFSDILINRFRLQVILWAHFRHN